MDTAVDTALSVGYRLFDTAKGYANEAQLGEALEKLLPVHCLQREDIFITTKVAVPTDPAEEQVRELVQDSLQKLRTNYIDLVLIHYPKSNSRENDDALNVRDRALLWVALTKLRDDGLVRSIGVSNFEVRHIEEIVRASSVPPAVNQVEYHPHFTRSDIKSYCDKHGIFLQAFSSLGRNHPDLITDQVVVELSPKYSTTPQLLLLSFATSQRIGVIPKSSDPVRIRENYSCLKLRLTDEDIQRLCGCNKNRNYINRTTGWLVR
ncbi:oxidoreductase [Aphelenchoides avenae]|nr:oxidoreductase [Aphelenchus avenae]